MGGFGVDHLDRQVQLARGEPGFERGVDPERSAGRAATSSTRGDTHPCRALHDTGGQKSLRGRIIGVEDGEDHTRVMPGGGEVRGGRGRQALDQVRLRLRAGDHHEDVPEAFVPGY